MSETFYPFSRLSFEVLETVHQRSKTLSETSEISLCVYMTAYITVFCITLNFCLQTRVFPTLAVWVWTGATQCSWTDTTKLSFHMIWMTFPWMYKNRAELVLFDDITKSGTLTQGQRGQKVSLLFPGTLAETLTRKCLFIKLLNGQKLFLYVQLICNLFTAFLCLSFFMSFSDVLLKMS